MRDDERTDAGEGGGREADESSGREADESGVRGTGDVDDGVDDGDVRVLVRHGGGETETRAAVGATLRDHLLERGFSPYATVTERVNCGGNGLCATCGVRIRDGAPAPTHWHDRLAARFGYPRLSCQVVIEGPMVVELVSDKRVWGGRE